MHRCTLYIMYTTYCRNVQMYTIHRVHYILKNMYKCTLYIEYTTYCRTCTNVHYT